MSDETGNVLIIFQPQFTYLHIEMNASLFTMVGSRIKWNPAMRYCTNVHELGHPFMYFLSLTIAETGASNSETVCPSCVFQSGSCGILSLSHGIRFTKVVTIERRWKKETGVQKMRVTMRCNVACAAFQLWCKRPCINNRKKCVEKQLDLISASFEGQGCVRRSNTYCDGRWINVQILF